VSRIEAQMDTFVLNDTEGDKLEQIRQFIIEHDIVEVPPMVYRFVEALWPDLLHKVKPPLEMMH
jgi:hypothetical protein